MYVIHITIYIYIYILCLATMLYVILLSDDTTISIVAIAPSLLPGGGRRQAQLSPLGARGRITRFVFLLL